VRKKENPTDKAWLGQTRLPESSSILLALDKPEMYHCFFSSFLQILESRSSSTMAHYCILCRSDYTIHAAVITRSLFLHC
jgi:hypothetical protein